MQSDKNIEDVSQPVVTHDNITPQLANTEHDGHKHPRQHYIENNFDLEQLVYRATILLSPEVLRAPSEGLH